MAKRCLIETCKREAETYCYHCSQDVCTKHYLEHKKSIQEQLHPLIDEMNSIYDRLNHDDKDQSKSLPHYFIDVYSQVDQWRADCHDRIDIVYRRARSQIETIVKSHQNELTQKAISNLESLEKMRQQLRALLKDGDVTHRQLEALKRQLEEFKKKEQEAIKYPDIRIITLKFDIEKHINITTDDKHPMEKQQQLKCPQKSPSNKNLSMHHRLAGWPSSGQVNDKCPMCSQVFPFSMTMAERTVHINDHLPD
ncbi:unnamed protein product [Rotaria magnacalcarata]|uniref:Uncharacterized protein n=1 Tax=Rotaria magnacalcarata TaxID=392030 RepID=A0A817AHV2_9BILA|nr:unnamed protein product [Rotaria magnacalcarata]CAF2260507.1 unnamed protein product [Rotaria magnacalcarata]CAF4140882.1 unnamed protein product [Rotaria magnacalcarata]CAF4462754.1 unnamed protein product [Rotaria magnacalcarata]